jgi:hypothetical protein
MVLILGNFCSFKVAGGEVDDGTETAGGSGISSAVKRSCSITVSMDPVTTLYSSSSPYTLDEKKLLEKIPKGSRKQLTKANRKSAQGNPSLKDPERLFNDTSLSFSVGAITDSSHKPRFIPLVPSWLFLSVATSNCF